MTDVTFGFLSCSNDSDAIAVEALQITDIVYRVVTDEICRGKRP